MMTSPRQTRRRSEIASTKPELEALCREHIALLRPGPGGRKAFKGLDRNWLHQVEPEWPLAVKRRVYRYMHSHNLYRLSNLHDSALVELANSFITAASLPFIPQVHKEVTEKCVGLIRSSAEAWERDGLIVPGSNDNLVKCPLFQSYWDSAIQKSPQRSMSIISAEHISEGDFEDLNASPRSSSSTNTGTSETKSTGKRNAEILLEYRTSDTSKRPRMNNAEELDSEDFIVVASKGSSQQGQDSQMTEEAKMDRKPLPNSTHEFLRPEKPPSIKSVSTPLPSPSISDRRLEEEGRDRRPSQGEWNGQIASSTSESLPSSQASNTSEPSQTIAWSPVVPTRNHEQFPSPRNESNSKEPRYFSALPSGSPQGNYSSIADMVRMPLDQRNDSYQNHAGSSGNASSAASQGEEPRYPAYGDVLGHYQDRRTSPVSQQVLHENAEAFDRNRSIPTPQNSPPEAPHAPVHRDSTEFESKPPNNYYPTQNHSLGNPSYLPDRFSRPEQIPIAETMVIKGPRKYTKSAPRWNLSNKNPIPQRISSGPQQINNQGKLEAEMAQNENMRMNTGIQTQYRGNEQQQTLDHTPTTPFVSQSLVGAAQQALSYNINDRSPQTFQLPSPTPPPLPRPPSTSISGSTLAPITHPQSQFQISQPLPPIQPPPSTQQETATQQEKERYQPPAVTFTIDNRAESRLQTAEVQSLIGTFTKLARAVILPRGGKERTRYFPIGVVMWQTLPDFYKWHTKASKDEEHRTFTFELMDVTWQHERVFIVPDGNPDYYRLLKQYIWDLFWFASQLRGTAEVFRISITPSPPVAEVVPIRRSQQPQWNSPPANSPPAAYSTPAGFPQENRNLMSTGPRPRGQYPAQAQRQRTAGDKAGLKDAAKRLISSLPSATLFHNEVVGESLGSNFRTGPLTSCGMVIDQNSGPGTVNILSEMNLVIHQHRTHPEYQGDRYAILDIADRCICEIQGASAVLFYSKDSKTPVPAELVQNPMRGRGSESVGIVEGRGKEGDRVVIDLESSETNTSPTNASTPEILFRLQISAGGKFSPPHPKSILRPKITTAEFFVWFSQQTKYPSERPERLRFTLKDAMPLPKTVEITLGDGEEGLKGLRRDIKSQCEKAREFCPEMREFGVLVTVPGWGTDEGAGEGEDEEDW